MEETTLYLADTVAALSRMWPQNRMVQLVCHGHSVPAGYAATPLVRPFSAYPHLLHRRLAERFPYAVINVTVTAIGGENAEDGAERFQRDVLTHRPDVITIDYALNDRGIGLSRARNAWIRMIEEARQQQVPVLLLTPTWDQSYFRQDDDWEALCRHTAQIRDLAREYAVGLADVFAAWETYVGREPERLHDLLAHINHPTERGHAIAADVLGRFFPAR